MIPGISQLLEFPLLLHILSLPFLSATLQKTNAVKLLPRDFVFGVRAEEHSSRPPRRTQ
jgi:hypothetical protein